MPFFSSLARRSAPSRTTALVTALAVGVGLSALTAGPALAVDPIEPAAVTPVEIDVVTINDFHGRLEAGGASAGAAVLAGLVKQFESANPNTVFVSGGDNIGASTFTSFIQQDTPTIDALNAMGLDASSFGNHEFDQGRDDVDNRILPAADFPYLGANVYERSTGEPAYEEYWTAEFEGVTVGFIGAVTETTPSLVNPAGVESLVFGDVAEATNRVAAQLRDGDEANGEADVLILLVHEGAESTQLTATTNNTVFGDIVNGVIGTVDAVVSAHTQIVYNHPVPIPGTDRFMPVLQAGQYGEAYGLIELLVDPATGELLEISSSVAPLVGSAPADPAVAQIVADAVAFASVAGNESLGSISADIRRAVTTTNSENRGGESTLGNLVADAQLWATRDLGTDVALMNPGGLRTDLLFASTGSIDPDGNLTFREAANVQPFANTLVTLELTGAQLRAVLEQQWQPAGSVRPFLKLGISQGFEYTYNPGAAQGARIGVMTLDGAIVTDDQVLRIVTNSFLAAGGDNFGALLQGVNKADSGRIDLQAFVDYAAEFSPLSPNAAQRAVGAVLSAPDADGYSAGDSVTATLSSLLFSNAGDRDASVTLSIGGVEVGSAAIDPTIINATDESGRATVVFTVPASITGAQQLEIAVPDNGTSVSVPFAISPPIGIEKAPKIVGGVVVGRTVATDGGSFELDTVERTYQWLRDGEPIEGATGATYLVSTSDAGASLSVVVTASAAGFATTSSESADRKVSGKPVKLPKAA